MTNKPLQHLLLLIFLSAWSGFSFANITNYTYDNLNRLKTVTQNGKTTTYTYDKNGNRESISYPNGVKTRYVYNQLNRLTRQTVEKGGQTLASYTYTLKANGQRSSLTEHTGRVSNYVYDKLGRLAAETITDAINGNHTAVYTYDKVGNRLTQTVNGTTTSYTYNANDWVQTAGAVKYTYDNNGNTLTETNGADVSRYEYDARNKLVKATTPSETVTYQYNPQGLRTQKATSGATIDYLVDSQSGYGDVVAEYVNGVKTKTYAIGDDLISQTVGNATFYYGYDGLGSTRMLFADTGTVSDSYDYTAFGDIHGQSGSTDNTFLFTGEQYDSSVGQYYLRARYYNQAIGRFTQMDEFGGIKYDPRSLHKYLYVYNQPINLVDPSGFSVIAAFSGMSLRGTLNVGAVQGANFAVRRFLFSAGGEGVGLVGTLIKRLAMEAAEELIIDAAFNQLTKAGKGSRGHRIFEDKIKDVNNRIKKFKPLKGVVA